MDEIMAKLEEILRRQQELLQRQELFYEQTEALLSLVSLFQFRAPLPPMRKWAISPDFAVILVSQLMAKQPSLVFELGGGVSTLFTGYTLNKIGKGRVIAVDHTAQFFQITRQHILQHGLQDVAEVIHAPLKPIRLSDQSWEWYDLHAIPMIDFLVVDGPPQFNNPRSMVRYPALPLLYKHLNPGALILMDDADREDERKVAEAWQREFNITLLRAFETEKGTKLFLKT